MGSERIRYSVVIPTYNRAKLLELAMKSVLAQTFDDIELVISNGGSEDNTAEVVRSFRDNRIKYVEANRRLPVEQNYQQGLDNATGEFITFLSDDDAYTPELLECVDRVIEERNAKLVGYPYCRYYHADIFDFETAVPANSLLIESYGNEVREFSQREAAAQVLASSGLTATEVDPGFKIPYLSNAVYHRSIFDNLMKRRSNLFDFVPPDMYLALAVFFHADAYHCLDTPLLVWSNWEGNATATAARAQSKLKEHYRKLMDGRAFKHSPLHISLAFNCGAECVLEAFYEHSGSRGDVDWAHFFKKAWENFSYLRTQGVELDEEVAEFERALSGMPTHIQDEVNRFRRKSVVRAKMLLNEKVPALSRVGRRLLSHRRPAFKIVRGEDAGFLNVVEAAAAVLKV